MKFNPSSSIRKREEKYAKTNRKMEEENRDRGEESEIIFESSSSERNGKGGPPVFLFLFGEKRRGIEVYTSDRGR